MWSYTPFWTCVEEPRGGAFVNHSKFQEDFGVAPVIGVSGVATTGRIWAESQKIRNSLVIGGIRTGNLALSNDVTSNGNGCLTAHPSTDAPSAACIVYVRAYELR